MQSTSEIHLPQMSGFFLQSKMVSDCPGLEIEVQDCQRQRLDILRMERLQNALLLCIVKGNISRVVIQGAAEDSHFACEEDNHIILRNLDMGSSTDLKIPVVFRDEEMGTVDFEKMAKSIQGVAEAQKITSAEFAMEWMNRDYQGVIEIGGK